MTKKVIFHAGNQIGQSDAEHETEWDEGEESCHELMKRALLWSAGSWPEGDGDYSAVVWIEEDGDVLDREEVTIGADGELSFPG